MGPGVQATAPGDGEAGAATRARTGGAVIRRASEVFSEQVLLPAAVGVLTGAAVAAVGWLAEDVLARAVVLDAPGLVPALVAPLALLATRVVTLLVTRAEKPATAELYIESVHSPGTWIPLRQVPGRVMAAMTTVGFGGSQGLESPSALIGTGIAQVLGGRRDAGPAPGPAAEERRRSLLACGASAGIAAVFSSPGIGALYGIEIPWRRDIDAPRFVPCAIAAVAAFFVREWLVGVRHLVPVVDPPSLDGVLVAGIGLVALGCGLGARAFARVEEAARRAAGFAGPWPRALGAGGLLAGLAVAGHQLSAGTWITAGPGYLAADWVVTAHPEPWLLAVALLVRAAGTLVCVLGGGGGGVFTSLACCGVFVGEFVARCLGHVSGGVLPLIGAACFLGAGYRIPLACALYVAEQSGDPTTASLGLFAIAASQALMGDVSVSSAQLDRREVSPQGPTARP